MHVGPTANGGHKAMRVIFTLVGNVPHAGLIAIGRAQTAHHLGAWIVAVPVAAPH
jgi:hypothetical protein